MDWTSIWMDWRLTRHLGLLKFNTMKESFELQTTLNATASEVFKAWLDSELHSDMTGGEAEWSDQIGVTFSAWDGYISGKNLEIVQDTKIVQSWRTTEFAEKDDDSVIEVELNVKDDQTVLTLKHSNIPEGMTQYKQGWQDHYFSPMTEYFNSK